MSSLSAKNKLIIGLVSAVVVIGVAITVTLLLVNKEKKGDTGSNFTSTAAYTKEKCGLQINVSGTLRTLSDDGSFVEYTVDGKKVKHYVTWPTKTGDRYDVKDNDSGMVFPNGSKAYIFYSCNCTDKEMTATNTLNRDSGVVQQTSTALPGKCIGGEYFVVGDKVEYTFPA